MSTRFYLGGNAAEYAPSAARGAWDDVTSTLVRRLAPTPEGAAGTATLAETAAAAGRDVLLGRWVSDPALASGTLSGSASWVAAVLESAAAADLFWHVHVYVTAGDSDTVRGTLLADSIGAIEWPTAATGRGEGAKALTPVAVSAGDRLVVEVGYVAQNAVATSYSGTLHFGNTGATDLAVGSTNATTEPGWVEFGSAFDGLFYPAVSTLTDDFAGPLLNTALWDGSYGGVDVASGRGRVACAHIGGAPQYAAIYATPSTQAKRWHFADSAIFCEAAVVPGANGGTNAVYSHFAVTASANVSGSYAGVFYNAVANMLVLQSATGFSDANATYLPYDPIAHRWWRLRHAAGVLYWDTSPDGSTWTNRRALNPAPSWTNYSGLGVLLESTRDGGTNDYAEFDNVNVSPLVVHEASAAFSAVSAMSAAAVRAVPAAATFSAASAMSASATRSTAATATFSAASVMTAAAVRSTAATASFSAASAMSASATRVTAAAASFSAGSDMTTSAIRSTAATAALSAASSLTVAAVRTTGAAAEFSAASAMSASAEGSSTASASFSASSAFTAAAVPARVASAAFSAASQLLATLIRSTGATATLSAASGMTASIAGDVVASAVFSAASAMTVMAVVAAPPGSIPRSPHSITVVRTPVTVTAIRNRATVTRAPG